VIKIPQPLPILVGGATVDTGVAANVAVNVAANFSLRTFKSVTTDVAANFSLRIHLEQDFVLDEL